MSRRIMIGISFWVIVLGVVASVYIYLKWSHNKAYDKGVFVDKEVSKEYAGYIC